MGPLQHRRVSRAVDAWVDAELDPPRAGQVAAHVGECWDCSSAAETARLIKRSLRGRADGQPGRLATARLQRLAQQLLGR